MLGLRTTKNFVKENTAEVKLAVPKQPARRYVDDRNGDTFPLPPSGLEPHYIYKKVFSSLLSFHKLEYLDSNSQLTTLNYSYIYNVRTSIIILVLCVCCMYCVRASVRHPSTWSSGGRRWRAHRPSTTRTWRRCTSAGR